MPDGLWTPTSERVGIELTVHQPGDYTENVLRLAPVERDASMIALWVEDADSNVLDDSTVHVHFQDLKQAVEAYERAYNL